MLDGDDLKARFEQFVHSIEDGSIVMDAILVMAYVDPDQLEDETTTYQQATYGKAPIHRCLGLLDVAAHQMRTQDDT